MILVLVLLSMLMGCAEGEEGAPMGDPVAKPEAEVMREAEMEALATTGQPYQLVWWDDFTSTAINTAKWHKGDHAIGYDGAECHYNPAMLSVSNGAAVIQVQKVWYNGRAYSCGQLDTLGHKTFLYGLFQARMQCPKGSGLHCSFWLYPDNDIWPPEVDIIEVKGNETTEAGVAVHWPDPRYTGPYHPFRQWLIPMTDLSAGYHTFAVTWTPTSLHWVIDGVIVAREKDPLRIPHTPMRIVLDLALDEYGGGLDATTKLPAKMYVDYVRFFQQL